MNKNKNFIALMDHTYSDKISFGLALVFSAGIALEIFLDKIGLELDYIIPIFFLSLLSFVFIYLTPKILKTAHVILNHFVINLTSFIFGYLMSLSIRKLIFEENTFYSGFFVFLIFNIVYHYGEFLFVCYCHPKTLSWDSFLINHSWGYTLAISLGFCEYIIEMMYFHEFKNNGFLRVISMIVMSIGIFFRLAAFITAKSNFHHLIQYNKQPNHILITHGIYNISRHPSYFGFFMFALGAQLTLGNSFCFLTHSFILWRFFNERIQNEEETLIEFFGDDYLEYRKRTPTLIPFIK